MLSDPRELMGNAAMRGITLRVQRRTGPADVFSDPVIGTIEVSGPAPDPYGEAADMDAAAMLGGMGEMDPMAALGGGGFDPGLEGAAEFGEPVPQIDMMDENSVNQTAFIENDYPLAAQRNMGVLPNKDPRKMAPSIMRSLGF